MFQKHFTNLHTHPHSHSNTPNRIQFPTSGGGRQRCVDCVNSVWIAWAVWALWVVFVVGLHLKQFCVAIRTGLLNVCQLSKCHFICFSYVCQRENDLHNNYHISYQTTHEISEGCTQLGLSVNNVGMGMEWEKCVNCAIIFIYKYLEMGCQESIKQLWSFGCVYGI